MPAISAMIACCGKTGNARDVMLDRLEKGG
jgi:hypothetical protein